MTNKKNSETKNFYFISHKGRALKYKDIDALKNDINQDKFKDSLIIFENPLTAEKFILKYFATIEKEFNIINTKHLKRAKK